MPFNKSNIPCKFYQQGKCTKGNMCNYSHTSFNGSINNSTLQKSDQEKYNDFINDKSWDRLSKEVYSDMLDVCTYQMKPLTSSYSLGYPCSVNLIQGRDFSPEENRFLYWKLARQGSLLQYENEINTKAKDMEKCLEFLKGNARKGARFLQLATKNQKETGNLPSKPFIEYNLDSSNQQYSNHTSTPFGNPFNLSGNNSSKPLTQPMNSVFGQPTFGNKGSVNNLTVESQSMSFGSFGCNGNAFGQSSIPNSGGSFGKPSFGSIPSSNVFGNPTFGNISTNQTNTFGMPSFGNTNIQSPFGNISQGTSFNSNVSNTPTFGNNIFGSGSMNTSFTSGSNNQLSEFGRSSTNISSPFEINLTNQNAFKPVNSNEMFKPFQVGEINNSNSEMVEKNMGSKFLQGMPSDEDKLTVQELPKEIVDAFTAQVFIIGKVPDIPPPLELIT